MDGLRTGKADRDENGLISVDDAFLYAEAHVHGRSGEQHPQRWYSAAEGTLILARNPRIEPRDPGIDTALATFNRVRGGYDMGQVRNELAGLVATVADRSGFTLPPPYFSKAAKGELGYSVKDGDTFLAAHSRSPLEFEEELRTLLAQRNWQMLTELDDEDAAEARKFLRLPRSEELLAAIELRRPEEHYQRSPRGWLALTSWGVRVRCDQDSMPVPYDDIESLESSSRQSEQMEVYGSWAGMVQRSAMTMTYRNRKVWFPDAVNAGSDDRKAERLIAAVKKLRRRR